ncbi:hypothetical protein ORD22_02055 [Sporosarcina sp. GW1-11]|nr:hypothetical protein [Sporosarcina sp. GW1-11]
MGSEGYAVSIHYRVFHGLKVAKRSSDNLKQSTQAVEAEAFCDDFGFFHLPNATNIVYVGLDNVYAVECI